MKELEKRVVALETQTQPTVSVDIEPLAERLKTLEGKYMALNARLGKLKKE